jgi:hypothetical protein
MKLPTMPVWVRVKKVQAARITGWAINDERGLTLALDVPGGATVDVSLPYARMNKPEIGHWFLVDENGGTRTVSPQHFEQRYQRAPDPQPVLWPEIQRLASMQPQAELVKKMCEPVQRGGDIFGTRAQMDIVLGKGAA